MGDHGRGGIGGGGRRPPGGPGVVAPDPADRPGASGHRFGPGLVCSECGIRWDAHQRSPHPCSIDLPADPFARRPRPSASTQAAATEAVAPAAAAPEAARRIPPLADRPDDVESDDGGDDGR